MASAGMATARPPPAEAMLPSAANGDGVGLMRIDPNIVPRGGPALDSLASSPCVGASAIALSSAGRRPSFPLLAIVFSEFDNTAGPRITCQAPAGFLSDVLFDSISDFIITGPELVHKLVTVAAGPYQVIGYPMQLSHAKYHRNALLFNVSFVFPRDLGGHHPKSASEAARASTATLQHAASYSASAQLRPYHPVIRKLAMLLESLEVESEFLFHRADSESSKQALQTLVDRIFRNLNSYGECSVAVETTLAKAVRDGVAAITAAGPQQPPPPTNKIHLKLYPLLTLPPRHIPPYAVPVRVKDLDARWKAEWDLTLRQVVPFMDGVNYVQRISQLSGVHSALVAKCIRQLLYYEAVHLLDIFQFSNVYAPGERLREAGSAPPDACTSDRARVGKLRADARRSCRADPQRPKPAFSTLFRLWCGLHSGVSLGDFFRNLSLVLPEYPLHQGPPTLESLNIHPRRFVQFALINGFLRRVHVYPILVSTYTAATIHTPVTPATPMPESNGAPTPPSYAHGLGLGLNEATLIGLMHGRNAHPMIDELPQRRTDHHHSSSNKLRPSASTGKIASMGSVTSSASRSRQTTDDRDRERERERERDRDRATTPTPQLAYPIPNAPPLATPPPTPSSGGAPSSSTSFGSSFRLYERYLDGEHHMDHLSILVQRSFKQLDDEIRRSRRCILVHK